jgi:hypothetical protein
MRHELLAVGLLCLLAGCGTLSGTAPHATEAAPTAETMQAVRLNNLLTALGMVVTGTPTEQAEVMAAANRDYEQEGHQGLSALRYGLLLAAPDHPARNPEQALQVLREALAYPALLNPQERSLAGVEIGRVNAELRLATENQRLVAESQLERDRPRNSSSTAAQTRQMQALQEQNAQLRKERDEALAKLNAIAEFERRQADRPPANEGRNP